MPDRLEPGVLIREISDLEGRLGELRQAASMPEPDLAATLEAALVELELALTALRTVGSERRATEGRSAAAEAERRVLRTVFQDAPVPLFLLDRDARVRRVNRPAATLLGTSPGYVSGKPFTVFCDLPTRAALHSRLAEVIRTGRRRDTAVRFLSRKTPVDAVVTMARIWVKGEPDPLVVAAAARADAATGQTPGPAPSRPARGREGRRPDDDEVAALVHRMDVLAAASELLLDEPMFNETVAVRRCARLLAAELADWVLVDLAAGGAAAAAGDGAAGGTGGRLRRQVVIGPDDETVNGIRNALEELEPASGTLPDTVFTERRSALHPHVAELELLGTLPDGTPAAGLIGATTLLSVPIDDGDRCLGALTMSGSGEHGPFDLMDLGVAQRLGRYLGLVIRASRVYQRRAEVADALQASLLPRTLPDIPGLDLAARYLGATRGVEVGGDFYDVFETPAGWGMVLGDVCGKGEEAAAVTATARHGIRLLARWKKDPGEVLSMVNQTLLTENRFVTAVMAGLEARDDRVTVTLGTAGHPPAIVIRRAGPIRAAAGGGQPLGLFEDFELGVETIELGPGDTLILHSDGVLDACDLMRRRFGEERLMEVLAGNAELPVLEMLLAVERAINEFSDGDLRDDVAILALRVRPPSLN